MCRLVILSIALIVASAMATNVSKCSKGQPFPLSVDIEGCDEPPCDVIKGTTALMDVHFVGTKDNIRNLTAEVRATALGVTVPYELPEEIADVCNNLMYGAQCPIDKSEDVVYKFQFPIDQYYPEISVKVQISLMDEFNDVITCFVCNVKVKKGSGKPQLLIN